MRTCWLFPQPLHALGEADRLVSHARRSDVHGSSRPRQVTVAVSVEVVSPVVRVAPYPVRVVAEIHLHVVVHLHVARLIGFVEHVAVFPCRLVVVVPANQDSLSAPSAQSTHEQLQVGPLGRHISQDPQRDAGAHDVSARGTHAAVVMLDVGERALVVPQDVRVSEV